MRGEDVGMTGAKCRGLDVSFATAVAAPLRRPKVGVGHLPLFIEDAATAASIEHGRARS